jgi:glycosyltransferase involved in cell wall biosynthesis
LGIVPSRFPDPCPTVAIEAMACGVPIVGSRTGGLPDLVADGESGVLVPAGDPIALAAALQGVIGQPELLDAMSVAAHARAPRFLAANVIDRIEAVYTEVLA